MLTVAITATRRPAILKQTLDSFWSQMFHYLDDGIILRINIDPAGLDIDPFDVLQVANNYPWLGVDYRMPRTASFPRAFIWTLDHHDSDFTFNIEEDWELLCPVDLNAMMDIMKANPQLALLRLPIFESDAMFMNNWKIPYRWNGAYFECPQEHRRGLGFCGHPSLINNRFLERTVPALNPFQNPEKQYHHGDPDIINEVMQWEYGVYGKPCSGPYIRDIGRQWMVEHGFKKAGSKAFFVEWEAATA